MEPDAVIQPPVDLNVPVTNPQLSDAIDAFAKERTDATLAGLLQELNHATFLAVVLNGDATQQAWRESGRIPAGDEIEMLACTDANDRPLFPVFTDWAEIAAFTDQKVGTFVMPSADAWAFALAGSYAGIVVNPGGNALPLNVDQIKDLQRQAARSGSPPHLDSTTRKSSFDGALPAVLAIAAALFVYNGQLSTGIATAILAAVSVTIEIVRAKRRKQ